MKNRTTKIHQQYNSMKKILTRHIATLALAWTMTAHAQTSGELQQQYAAARAAATQTHSDTLVKIDAAYNSSVEAAKAEVRKAFEPLFRNAKPEEAKNYMDTMEALFGGGAGSRMTGRWIARDLNDPPSSTAYWNSNLFDFGDGKGMTLVSTRSASRGVGDGSFTKIVTKCEYTIKTEGGKILITPVAPDISSMVFYPPGVRNDDDAAKHRYEIQTPFDPNRPVMTLTPPDTTLTMQLEREQ